MTRLLFVCLGNICRSPLAEGLFIKKVKDLGIYDRFTIDSAGTSAYHIGSLPDPRTRKHASEQGVHLGSCARQFKKADFFEFDLILAMDKENMRNIQSLEPAVSDPLASVMLMREFDPLGKGLDVPDPYYGGERGFQDVYDILDRSTSQLLEYLLKNQS